MNITNNSDIKYPTLEKSTKKDNFIPSLNTIKEDINSSSNDEEEEELELNIEKEEKQEKEKNIDEIEEHIEENIDEIEENIETNNENNVLSQEKLDELENREMEKLADDFVKMNNREVHKKKQIELVIKIFKLLNFNVKEMKDLEDIVIQRERLLEKNTEKKILELVPELKEVYNSSYLTCLHDNSIFKQKFPAINLIRQVLKCNHLSLTPKIVSCGYEKLTGRKIVSRIFVIDKILF